MRKKPFSGKQKKHQLQARRQAKQDKVNEGWSDEEKDEAPIAFKQHKLVMQPTIKPDNQSSKTTHYVASVVTDRTKKNKLVTVFEKETDKEIKQRKKDAQIPIKRLDRVAVGSASAYYGDTIIDMPKRPPWSHNLTKEQLEANEKAYFSKWLDNIYQNYPQSRLNFFEHNLEVWRQLWRVVERSDIICVITDSRHPLFHFPPSLHRYITDHKKSIVLVLNKIDLIPNSILEEWIEYFQKNYPNIKVVTFTNYPNNQKDLGSENISLADDFDVNKKQKQWIKKKYTAVGIDELVRVCASFGIEKANGKVHMEVVGKKQITQEEKIENRRQRKAKKANRKKIIFVSPHIQKENEKKEMEAKKKQNFQKKDKDENENEEEGVEGENLEELENLEYENEEKIKQFDAKVNYVTIGLLGHPNVGKSSIVNGILGRKVVSTSISPGHTKHLQTIFYSKNIRLCDCPGLTFPAIDMPRALQIISGLYPVAQVREPYSSVRFLGERMDLVTIYDLAEFYDEVAPENNGNVVWTPWRICEALAAKRGFQTRNGAYDCHRSGNAILRDAVGGLLPLFFHPPENDGTPADNNEEDEEEEEEEEEKPTNATVVPKSLVATNMFALLGDEDS